MKRILKMLILVFLLLIIYIYVLVIQKLPTELVVFQGEEISLKTLYGLTFNKKEIQTIETSSNEGTKVSDNIGKTTIEVSLFDKLLIKNIEVSVIPNTTVIPVGNIAGVKLYTNGVLVVGMSEITGEDNKKYRPYENSGIQEGDTIIKVNDKYINSTKELEETINRSNGIDINIKYMHKEDVKECSITPIKTENSEYKLGLWVRDSAAGVGTVSFYEPSTRRFGALGHGIADIDTNELINIASGEFVTTKIVNITKGEIGNPRKNERNN